MDYDLEASELEAPNDKILLSSRLKAVRFSHFSTEIIRRDCIKVTQLEEFLEDENSPTGVIVEDAAEAFGFVPAETAKPADFLHPFRTPDKDCYRCHLKPGQCAGHMGYIELGDPYFLSVNMILIVKILNVTCADCGFLLTPLSVENEKQIIQLHAQQKNYSILQLVNELPKCKQCPNCNPNKGPHEYQSKTVGFRLKRVAYGTPIILHVYKEEKEQLLRPLTAPMVHAMLKRIPLRTASMLGFNENHRPEELVPTLLVLPAAASIRGSVLESREETIGKKKVLMQLQKKVDALDERLKQLNLDIRNQDLSDEERVYYLAQRDEVEKKRQEVIQSKQFRPTESFLSHYQTILKLSQEQQADRDKLVRPRLKPFERDEIEQEMKRRRGNIQREITTILDSNDPTKTYKGLRQALKSKEGIIRQHVFGKRADFTARMVLAHDPNLRFNEISVPRHVKRLLTTQEICFAANRLSLYQLILDGQVVSIRRYNTNEGANGPPTLIEFSLPPINNGTTGSTGATRSSSSTSQVVEPVLIKEYVTVRNVVQYIRYFIQGKQPGIIRVLEHTTKTIRVIDQTTVTTSIDLCCLTDGCQMHSGSVSIQWGPEPTNVFTYTPKNHLEQQRALYMQRFPLNIKDTLFLSLTPAVAADVYTLQRFEQLRKHGVELGDRVERVMREGDMVIFNRQPTLHKYGMLAFYVRFWDKNVFGLPLLWSTAYNFDFDGDEGTIHRPQSLQAQAELQEILAGQHNMINTRDNTPICGLTLDSILITHYMTQPLTFVRRQLYKDMEALVQTDIANDFAMRPQRATVILDALNSLGMRLNRYSVHPLSGYAVFSLLLPKGFYYSHKSVVIEDGVLVKGPVTKEHIGGGENTIIQSLYRHPEFGPKVASWLVSLLPRFCNILFVDVGSTLGMDDLRFLTDANRAQIDELRQMVVKNVNDLTKTLTKENERLVENEITIAVNQYIAKAMDLVYPMLPKDNMMRKLYEAGVKSDLKTAIPSIVGSLGQQMLYGQRVGTFYETQGERCLPYFNYRAFDADSRGFVSSSYLEGMNPTEFILAHAAGREGLIDKSLLISDGGHLGNRLNSMLRDVFVAYDYSVRKKQLLAAQPLAHGDGFAIDKTLMSHGVNTFIDLKNLAKELNSDSYQAGAPMGVYDRQPVKPTRVAASAQQTVTRALPTRTSIVPSPSAGNIDVVSLLEKYIAYLREVLLIAPEDLDLNTGGVYELLLKGVYAHDLSSYNERHQVPQNKRKKTLQQLEEYNVDTLLTPIPLAYGRRRNVLDLIARYNIQPSPNCLPIHYRRLFRRSLLDRIRFAVYHLLYFYDTLLIKNTIASQPTEIVQTVLRRFDVWYQDTRMKHFEPMPTNWQVVNCATYVQCEDNGIQQLVLTNQY